MVSTGSTNGCGLDLRPVIELVEINDWAGLDRLDQRVQARPTGAGSTYVGRISGQPETPHTIGASSTSGNFFSAYFRYCAMWSSIAAADCAGSLAAIAS